MWLEEEGCRETVEVAWSLEAQGHAMARVEAKIGYYQSKLKWWSRVAIGNITWQLKEKKKKRIATQGKRCSSQWEVHGLGVSAKKGDK